MSVILFQWFLISCNNILVISVATVYLIPLTMIVVFFLFVIFFNPRQNLGCFARLS